MATPAETNHAQRRMRAVLALCVTALIATALLTWLSQLTQARIARNEQAWLIYRLDMLVPPHTYDNDLLNDRIEVISPDLLGTSRPVAIYRARRNGEPVAAVLRPIAPDGYRGAIELLVAVNQDGTLIGVQVLQHRETPGLGDAFERREPQWLQQFAGRSLSDPPQQRWTVRRDGGDFDQFTGATITPRAIVKGVRRALEYYATHRNAVFREPSE